jgi:hypothetical protein
VRAICSERGHAFRRSLWICPQCGGLAVGGRPWLVGFASEVALFAFSWSAYVLCESIGIGLAMLAAVSVCLWTIIIQLLRSNQCIRQNTLAAQRRWRQENANVRSDIPDDEKDH